MKITAGRFLDGHSAVPLYGTKNDNFIVNECNKPFSIRIPTRRTCRYPAFHMYCAIPLVND